MIKSRQTDVLKALRVGDVVHNNDAVRSSVVRACDCAEPLLASGIPVARRWVRTGLALTNELPDLKFQSLPIELQSPNLKVNANRANVTLSKGVVGEAKEEARLRQSVRVLF